jgi:hypothetical protein
MTTTGTLMKLVYEYGKAVFDNDTTSTKAHDTLRTAIESLARERDAALADAVDAERYRWWRDHGYTTDSEKLGIENEMLPAGEVFETLDAAIDSAREKT